jgi:hypothetical protein
MSTGFRTYTLTLKDGELHKLKVLMREMSDGSKANEPGTLIYEWAISADE